jgi:hypothetical protein
MAASGIVDFKRRTDEINLDITNIVEHLSIIRDEKPFFIIKFSKTVLRSYCPGGKLSSGFEGSPQVHGASLKGGTCNECCAEAFQEDDSH